jgi:hypothetical protein
MALAVASILNAELSIPWTTHDFDRWLERIPARERADVKWARPILESALDALLTQPLETELIDDATRQFVCAGFRFRAVLLRMLSEQLPLAELYEGLLVQIPEVLKAINSAIVEKQAETAIRVVVCISTRFYKVLKDLEFAEREEFVANLMKTDCDELAVRVMEEEQAPFYRSQAIVAALLEGARRNTSQARMHELSRLALRHSLRALGVARRAEVIANEDVQRSGLLQKDDDLLVAAAALAIAGRENLAEELTAAECLPEWMYARALIPQAIPQPQVQRVTGRITGVTLQDPITIGIEGHHMWLPATPEQLERAVSLRSQPVVATILTGPYSRILRLDAVGNAPQSDSASRTRDMFHDWEELLERLAQ